jgi:hypothetical protein
MLPSNLVVAGKGRPRPRIAAGILNRTSPAVNAEASACNRHGLPGNDE